MNIQDQCCSLEQAQRLKELGIAQDGSYFRINPEGELVEEWTLEGTEDFIACFTVAELGHMLPDYYPSWQFEKSRGGEKFWIATVICSPKPPNINDIHTALEFDRYGQTQAQALATLLIALLETKTITPEQVNARLKG